MNDVLQWKVHKMMLQIRISSIDLKIDILLECFARLPFRPLGLFSPSIHIRMHDFMRWKEFNVFIAHDCNKRPVFGNVNAKKKLERSLKQNRK